MYTEGLQLKVKRLSREDLERLAVQALFHLRCVSGSRNSYDPEYHEQLRRVGWACPTALRLWRTCITLLWSSSVERTCRRSQSHRQGPATLL